MRTRMTPDEWVDAVNAVAKNTALARKAAGIDRRGPMGVEVRVLIRAIYARPDWKSHGWCEVGDIIEVPRDNYVGGLIEKGMVTLEVKQPVIPQRDEPEATAAARKLAAEWQVDLRDVEATGSGGKIVKTDVEDFLGRGDEDEAVLAEVEEESEAALWEAEDELDGE